MADDHRRIEARWQQYWDKLGAGWRSRPTLPGPESLPTLSLKRWEWVAIGGLVVLSCAVHLFFRMRGFGEQDEARFAIYALAWHETKEFPIDTYTNRTSPLYLIYMRLLLSVGLPPLAMPEHLNYLNVIFGGLALIPMFVLFRRLIKEPWLALLAVFAYWFAPVYWVGSSYGMPHVPALAFFLISLVFFADALDRKGAVFRKNLLIAQLTMATAVCLKSDIVLCGLAYPALVFCLGPRTWRNLLASLPIPVIAAIVVMIVSRVFLPVPISSTQFAKSWNQTFPFTASVLLNLEHWKQLKNTLGGVLWGAAGVAALVTLATKERKLVLLALVWLLPTSVFWGLIAGGNAVRHYTMAFCPIALILVVGMRASLRSTPLVAAGLCILLFFNYRSAPPSANPHTASPRLFESHALMQKRNANLMESCSKFAQHPAVRKLLVGYWAIPYCEYAILARAERFRRWVITDGVLWEFEVWPKGSSMPTFVRVRRGSQLWPERASQEEWLIWHAELGRAL